MFGYSVAIQFKLYKVSDQLLEFTLWELLIISYIILNLSMMPFKTKIGVMVPKDNGEDYVTMDKLNLQLNYNLYKLKKMMIFLLNSLITIKLILIQLFHGMVKKLKLMELLDKLVSLKVMLNMKWLPLIIMLTKLFSKLELNIKLSLNKLLMEKFKFTTNLMMDKPQFFLLCLKLMTLWMMMLKNISKKINSSINSSLTCGNTVKIGLWLMMKNLT